MALRISPRTPVASSDKEQAAGRPEVHTRPPPPSATEAPSVPTNNATAAHLPYEIRVRTERKPNCERAQPTFAQSCTARASDQSLPRPGTPWLTLRNLPW
ncbi:hypothetical protein EVG20_g8396 [Dentipellis fragilis]|uniref:Uncharacterized protein n=1 Tax=Dentipellis fragilis TaxID=205917 RepID=A0A4Y9Y8Q3_9AGAM|nr:hypothetical protein EVG20_g8396 [Dentipellis fragilis]